MKKTNLCSMNLGLALMAVLMLSLATVAQAQMQVLEVMYNATDDNAWEWIEVRNDGASAIDLNGYLGFNLGDADITSPTATLSTANDPDTTVNPGEIAVIYDAFYGTGHPKNFNDEPFRTAWGLSAGVKLIGADFFPGMSNTVGNQGQSIGFWATDADWKLDQTPVEDDPVNNPGVFTNRTSSFAHAAFSLDFHDASFPAVDGVSSITWTGNGSNSDGSQWVQSVSGTNGAVTSSIYTYAGSTNSTNDIANPGIVSASGAIPVAASGLIFTEIMYDPASSEVDPRWEWVEVHNTTASPIDMTGWVFDDDDSGQLAASNIAGGVVPAGGTAILYNNILAQTEFEAAWGTGLNLIAVSGWSATAMGLSNSGDKIALWDSFGAYNLDSTVHANAKISFAFPDLAVNGPSIFLADASLDPLVTGNWIAAADLDAFGSHRANALSGTVTLHPGGDVGSPGSFTVVVGQPGDFDGDGDVDGQDFLEWQRTDGTPAGLALWNANYPYNPPLVAAANAVPEPASLALVALALGTVLAARKR